MNLCVIPARGGSKRIPRKNIKPFAGKPMIAYAIEAATDSRLFSRIIVSTDDPEVKEVSQKYGAEAPFLRPAELSDDHTPTVPVIAHAIRTLGQTGQSFEYVCCIYPCVPFLKEKDLVMALHLLKKGQADYSISVTEYPSPIQRALKMDAQGRIHPRFPEFELTRTQDLEASYHDAGQFYWGKCQTWLKKPCIHSNGVGLKIPNFKVVDIDTPKDWIKAELLYQAYHSEAHSIKI